MDVKVGDLLFTAAHHDPASDLVVVSTGSLAVRRARVIQAAAPGQPLVDIRTGLIDFDGTQLPGRYMLVRASPAALGLIGKPIWLRRGSARRASGLGRNRLVLARLDCVIGTNVWATLLQDDPGASVAPFAAGHQGVWFGEAFIHGPAYEVDLPLCSTK